MTVHWTFKWSAYAASVFTLSLFFAGHRQVMQTGGLADWALLAAGVLLTLALLMLQGYWIYFEEKSKGSLKKRIQLFETIHEKLEGKLDRFAKERLARKTTSPLSADKDNHDEGAGK